jgi:hypothetical protein
MSVAGKLKLGAAPQPQQRSKDLKTRMSMWSYCPGSYCEEYTAGGAAGVQCAARSQLQIGREGAQAMTGLLGVLVAPESAIIATGSWDNNARCDYESLPMA